MYVLVWLLLHFEPWEIGIATIYTWENFLQFDDIDHFPFDVNIFVFFFHFLHS